MYLFGIVVIVSDHASQKDDIFIPVLYCVLFLFVMYTFTIVIISPCFYLLFNFEEAFASCFHHGHIRQNGISYS